jgi:hypothetical protein
LAGERTLACDIPNGPVFFSGGLLVDTDGTGGVLDGPLQHRDEVGHWPVEPGREAHGPRRYPEGCGRRGEGPLSGRDDSNLRRADSNMAFRDRNWILNEWRCLAERPANRLNELRCSRQRPSTCLSE